MADTISPAPPSRRQRLLRAIFRNPVTVKELRSRMRGRRAFVVLTTYLLLMSAFITLVYILYSVASRQPFGGPDARQAGKTVFVAVLGVQMLLVVFIGPAFTSGAISGEKERQTYSLLRTTLLSPHSLVMGKLVSALSYVFLLLFAAVPLQSIAFLLGGISLIELMIGTLLVSVSAVAFAMLGLFFSSLLRSTLAASVATFAVSLFLTVGMPAIMLIILSVVGPLLFGVSSPSPLTEVLAVYGGLILASFNLPATVIISDIFLLQEGAIFGYTHVVSPYTVIVFSPWTVYLFIYGCMALILYLLTVRRVRRTPVR